MSPKNEDPDLSYDRMITYFAADIGDVMSSNELFVTASYGDATQYSFETIDY